MGRSTRSPRAPGPILGALTLLLAASGLLAAVLPAAAAPSYPTLSGAIHGPTTVGAGTKNSYTLTGTGGPAFGFNGTQIGTMSYSTTVVGLNTSAVQFLPTAGILTNGSAILTLQTSNLTQTLTLNVELKSGFHGTNVSTNLTIVVVVVEPYSLHATLLVNSGVGTMPFALTVELDGAPVGEVEVPSLTGHASYQLTFVYVNPSLPAGWHTFSLSLAQQHGLVVFSNGAESFSQSFYVSAPAPNDTLWFTAGAVLFVGAIFIWLMAVGGRRRGRKR